MDEKDSPVLFYVFDIDEEDVNGPYSSKSEAEDAIASNPECVKMTANYAMFQHDTESGDLIFVGWTNQ